VYSSQLYCCLAAGFAIPRKNEKKKRRDLAALRRETEAADEGGPTRQFFNEVNTQLGDLSVSIQMTKNVKLFESTPGGLLPLTDDMIKSKTAMAGEEQEAVVDQIKCYYRAVGRLMAHCIFQIDNAHGQLPILQHALPSFYKQGEVNDLWQCVKAEDLTSSQLCSVLLRGVNPTDDEYLNGSLYLQAYDLLKPDDGTKTFEEKVELVCKRLGLVKDEGPEQNSLELRNCTDELYLKNRKIAVESMRDGISLSGRWNRVALRLICWCLNAPHTCEPPSRLNWIGNVNWGVSCLRFMPLEAVEAILFASQKVTTEMLFDGEGGFRFIAFKSVFGYGDDLEEYACLSQTQELLKKRIEKLFREKAESGKSTDSAFLRDFVEFCTGQSYLPDLDSNPQFIILVEFNADENETREKHLPVAHTCDNAIKLPSTAYDGNIEEFERLLTLSLKYSKNCFGMK
jgi:hypothetical protein